MTREQAIKLVRSEMASIGGTARAKKLTPERRKEIAQLAAQARWKVKK